MAETGQAGTQAPQSMQRERSTSTMDRRSAAAEREIASVGHMAMQFPEHSQRNVVKACPAISILHTLAQADYSQFPIRTKGAQ